MQFYVLNMYKKIKIDFSINESINKIQFSLVESIDFRSLNKPVLIDLT